MGAPYQYTQNDQGTSMLTHRLLAARALGRPLPPKAQVHHVNNDGLDPSPGNLVLCENRAYHGLIEQRTRALRATGNANARKCRHCKKWETDPGSADMYARGSQAHHRPCHNAYLRKRWKENPGARAKSRELNRRWVADNPERVRELSERSRRSRGIKPRRPKGVPAHYRKCAACQKYDDPTDPTADMYTINSSRSTYHRACQTPRDTTAVTTTATRS